MAKRSFRGDSGGFLRSFRNISEVLQGVSKGLHKVSGRLSGTAEELQSGFGEVSRPPEKVCGGVSGGFIVLHRGLRRL